MRPAGRLLLLWAIAIAPVAATPAVAAGDINSSPNLPQAVDTNTDPNVFETTLTARLSTFLTVPGLGFVTNAITFNGTIPGPEIRVKVGDTVIVHYQNQLPTSSAFTASTTSIHWHGVELDNASDGTAVTELPVPPGGSYTYKFKVPRAGIFWYHPHMSPTDPVFRGQYGSLIVTGPDDLRLQGLGVLPPPAQTKTLVLADTTVCNNPGSNSAQTFTQSFASGPSDFPPWAGDVNGDGLRDAFPGKSVGPSPRDLCEQALNAYTSPTSVALQARQTPNVEYDAERCPRTDTQLIDLSVPCTISEGQNVLVNGAVPVPRSNPPDAFPTFTTPQPPGRLPNMTGVMNVTPGEAVRLQLINAADARYFRLQFEDAHGNILRNLVRIGGEGGLLNRARIEGGANPNPRYLNFDGHNTAGPPQIDVGEILLAPGNRSDVVLHVPTTAAPGDVLTIWTRDFQRGMGSDGANPLEHPPAGPCPAGIGHCGPNGFSLVPTVPVLHMLVQAGTSQPASVGNGTPLEADSRIGHPNPDLRCCTPAALMTPAQAGQTVGSASSRIELDMGNPTFVNERPMIDSVPGMLDNNRLDSTSSPQFASFTQVPRPTTTRYAHLGDLIELTIDNSTGMNHPFHLHGFSFQPIRLEWSPRCGGPTNPTFTFDNTRFDFPEYLDTFDVPACSRLVFRVLLQDRPKADGSPGGGIGRWVFHCHIFEHASDGMMGELDVLPPAGPKFFGLGVRGSEQRGATIKAVLRKPRELVLNVQQVSGRRLIGVGLVRLGHHRAGSSRIHWDLRVHGRLLPPGRYAVGLHGVFERTLLSMPADPGIRTLIVSRGGRVRVRHGSPVPAKRPDALIAGAGAWAANALYCRLLFGV